MLGSSSSRSFRKGKIQVLCVKEREGQAAGTEYFLFASAPVRHAALGRS